MKHRLKQRSGSSKFGCTLDFTLTKLSRSLKTMWPARSKTQRGLPPCSQWFQLIEKTRVIEHMSSQQPQTTQVYLSFKHRNKYYFTVIPALYTNKRENRECTRICCESCPSLQSFFICWQVQKCMLMFSILEKCMTAPELLWQKCMPVM